MWSAILWYEMKKRGNERFGWVRKLVGGNKGSCRNKLGERSTTDTSDAISGREDINGDPRGFYISFSDGRRQMQTNA